MVDSKAVYGFSPLESDSDIFDPADPGQGIICMAGGLVVEMRRCDGVGRQQAKPASTRKASLRDISRAGLPLGVLLGPSWLPSLISSLTAGHDAQPSPGAAAKLVRSDFVEGAKGVFDDEVEGR